MDKQTFWEALMSFPLWLRVLGSIPIVVGFVIHLIFAAAVFDDARREQCPKGRLMFVGPGVWAVAVFLSSVPGVALYWLIHHSTLRPSMPEARA